MHGAVGERPPDLLRERRQLFGVLLEVAGVLVAHGAQRLASECPRDDRAVLSRPEQRVLVSRRRSRLGRGDEAGADPNTVGAEGQCGGETAAVEDAAGRDHGDPVADRVDDLGDERQRRHGPRVAAGLGALRDDDVAAGLDRTAGVVDLPAHVHDEHAVAVAELHDVTRYAEAGDEDRRALVDEELHLRGQIAGHRRQ
jgi:hypothetical protein